MSRTRKNSRQPGKITISSTRLPTGTGEQFPSFGVHVQVEIGDHHVAWTMTMLPGTQVPVRLDENQEVVLIAHGQELLVDSSRVDRAFPVIVQEADLDGRE